MTEIQPLQVTDVQTDTNSVIVEPEVVGVDGVFVRKTHKKTDFPPKELISASQLGGTTIV